MNDSIRTLHVDTETGWRGGEQQAMYLMQGLLERGHKVACACRPSSAMADRCRENGIEYHEVKMRSEADVGAAAKLRGLVRKLDAQVIHAHTAHAHALAAMAALGVSGCKCVVSRRVDFALRRNPLSRLKYRAGVDRYIAISQAVRQVMIDGGVRPERISVAHSGIDLGRFDVSFNTNLRHELGIPPEALIVGNIAALVDHKGQTYLIDAVPDVLDRCPAARFIIAGDGELREPLERQAAERGVADRVMFLGYREDVPSLLNMFDVLVMSSHLEGLCTSLLDAMAMELPIAAAAAGGIPEIVRDGVNGLLVEVKNPPALARAIVELIEDRDKASRLAEEGRRIVEREFSSDAMVEKTLSVYRELLQRGAGFQPGH